VGFAKGGRVEPSPTVPVQLHSDYAIPRAFADHYRREVLDQINRSERETDTSSGNQVPDL
jgi:hypothetical protein